MFGNRLSGAIRGTNGTENTATTPPTDKEIRKNMFLAEQEINRAERAISIHKQRYMSEIEQGANAPSERRRVHAIKARFEKFKAKIQELKRLKALHALSVWTVAEGAGTIDAMLDEVRDSISVQQVAGLDPATLQSKITEVEATIAGELAEMDDIMGALDVETATHSVETTDEEALMNQVAAGEIQLEELTIDTTGLDLTDIEADTSMDTAESAF
jgi:hypothetical protein